MPINPSAPNHPEIDIALLSGTGQFVPNSPGYPEIDISLLPGVPGQRGSRGPTGPTGTTGPTGPTGPAGSLDQLGEVLPGLVSYRHSQTSAQTTWTITHNLNFRPNVTAFDSAGNIAEGSIVHLNANSLTIQFSAAISGNAVLS